MARVMIDTTYLLPAAGIRVEGVPPDATRRVKEAGNEVLACDISLFEVLAKGAKLVSEGRADPGRVMLAIKSILSDGSIRKTQAYTQDTMTMAIEFREHHSDFVDCLILASAANESDSLLTEDVGISKNDGLIKALLRHNPKFRVSNISMFSTRQQ